MYETQTTKAARQVTMPRDGDGRLIIMNGGLQAYEAGNNQWCLAPLLINGNVYSSIPYNKGQIRQLMREHGLRFVAYQHISVTDGVYSSSWYPMAPGERDLRLGPADRWGNVASRLAQCRLREAPPDLPAQEWLPTLDARSEPERLAQSISLSLHNVGTAVEAIAMFYHEELTNLLRAGHTDGTRVGTTMSQMLYAQVHGFFVHIGAARDYLATFIALQLGLDHHKVDDLARLVDKIRTPDLDRNPILNQLRTSGCLSIKDGSGAKWELGGWLKEISTLRKMFVHKRTYGQWASEMMGYLEPLDSAAGLYRYTRPIVTEGETADVLDVLIGHYQQMTRLFYDAVLVCGLNSEIPVLTDDDIIAYDAG